MRYTTNPRIYLVGRNKAAATNLIKEFSEINKGATTEFIESDVALLKNVDKACEEIKAKESKINLLSLSAGFFTFKGRDETSEGLDKKLSLHYYSRMRFAQQLMPLLAKGAETPAEAGKLPLARVISVLGAGHEGAINLEDFDLKNTYSLSKCATHAQTGNTLAPYALWSSDPLSKNVTFIHSAPGGVDTSLSKKGGVAGWTLKVLFPVVKAVMPSQINSIDECGERHLWAATADEFGEGGVVLLAPKSDVIKSPEVIEKMRKDGTEQKLWEHTTGVFKKIIEEGGKY